MAEETEKKRRTKVCFVTVGATAKFDDLIQELLGDDCVNALASVGYSVISLQYGHGKELAERCYTKLLQTFQDHLPGNIVIDAFDFSQVPLTDLMRRAKAEQGREEGMIITHAGILQGFNLCFWKTNVSQGAGSIMEATRMGVPVIAVPNPSLLGNHQEELAQTFSTMGYLYHGKLG
jgi:beta-1,4-N-acetylglucosaminyltransferase